MVDRKLEALATELGREPVVLSVDLYRPSNALRYGSSYGGYLMWEEVNQLYPNEREFGRDWEQPIAPEDIEEWDVIIAVEAEIASKEGVMEYLNKIGNVKINSEGPRPLLFVHPSSVIQGPNTSEIGLVHSR